MAMMDSSLDYDAGDRDRQLEKRLAMRHEIRICSVTKDGGPKDTVYL